VWWGKFGAQGLSDDRLAQIKKQLDAGQRTRVFLRGADSLWETTLLDITQDKAKVDSDRLPEYYTVSDAKLFVLLKEFKPITIEWFLKHAVLDSNPQPGSAQTALSSQANPAYIRLLDVLVSVPPDARPICLLGTSRDIGAWEERAQRTIDQQGAWASWWSFIIKEEAGRELTTPFELYINTGGGEFPLRCIVSEYQTSRGSTGIPSPWPAVTDPEDVGKTSAGDRQSLLFKTWFRISAIERLAPPKHLGDFEAVPGLSAPDNLLNQNAFGYARLASQASMSMDSLVEQTLLDRKVLQELIDGLKGTHRQLVLTGPPGTSKTFIAESVARFVCQAVPDSFRLVQFHPSYGYESFIEGLRPVVRQGGISFERENGVVLEMAATMVQRGHIHPDSPPYVVVIDEMNRANLPRVFGELMYLFEYRDRPVRLQYTPQFSLPPNLGFIGTMNTADRSIRSIDAALRRRFDVFEFAPSKVILERFFARNPLHVPNLISGFEELNTALEGELDRHHTIGHTFFMKSGLDRRALIAIWERKVYPLIEEYFFDQPDIAREFKFARFWPELAT
jgi:hypothetical protein